MPTSGRWSWSAPGGSTRRKYVAGLAAAAERAGASLHEGVRALRVRPQADGRAVVETSVGPIVAREVFVGTNGYTDGAAPELRRRVMPIGSYIIATDPLSEDLAREISPKGRMFFDSKNFLYYWRITPDRRMLFGGRASFWPSSVDRTARILLRGMLRVHPQLAGVRVAYAWGGKVGFTFDRMPHVGPAGRHHVRQRLLRERRRDPAVPGASRGGLDPRRRAGPGARVASLPAGPGAVRGPPVVPAGRRGVVPPRRLAGRPGAAAGLTDTRRVRTRARDNAGQGAAAGPSDGGRVRPRAWASPTRSGRGPDGHGTGAHAGPGQRREGSGRGPEQRRRRAAACGRGPDGHGTGAHAGPGQRRAGSGRGSRRPDLRR